MESWNGILYGIELLYLHIRKALSQSHMTCAETVPIESKSGSYVKHTIRPFDEILEVFHLRVLSLGYSTKTKPQSLIKMRWFTGLH